MFLPTDEAKAADIRNMDGKYANACFRAERIIASFCKEYGERMTKMAFEHELKDIDL